MTLIFLHYSFLEYLILSHYLTLNEYLKKLKSSHQFFPSCLTEKHILKCCVQLLLEVHITQWNRDIEVKLRVKCINLYNFKCI